MKLKILRMINTLILFVLIGKLSQASIEFSYRIIDDPLKPYVKEYHELLKTYCKNNNYNKTNRFIIELVDTMDNESWVGVCQIKLNGFTIQIDRTFWENTTEKSKRQLMYHELAHCLIYRDHDENNKKHYMYPSFYPLPAEDYINQAIDDIVEFCKE